MLNATRDAVHNSYTKFTVADTITVLECLQASYDFSHEINGAFQNCMNMQIVDQMTGLQLFRGIV